MSEIAYALEPGHFINQEVNFEKLREYGDNVILSYSMDNKSYNDHFKRSMAELDRLGFNIGISVFKSKSDTFSSITDLIDKIKGYKINLGVWTNDFEIFGRLLYFKDNFIAGIISDDDQLKYPRLGYNGDLILLDYEKFDFNKYEVITIKINNDYKTIYENNKLKPIPSTYKINEESLVQ